MPNRFASFRIHGDQRTTVSEEHQSASGGKSSGTSVPDEGIVPGFLASLDIHRANETSTAGLPHCSTAEVALPQLDRLAVLLIYGAAVSDPDIEQPGDGTIARSGPVGATAASRTHRGALRGRFEMFGQ